jgi:hypothetical protein
MEKYKSKFEEAKKFENELKKALKTFITDFKIDQDKGWTKIIDKTKKAIIKAKNEDERDTAQEELDDILNDKLAEFSTLGEDLAKIIFTIFGKALDQKQWESFASGFGEETNSWY